MRRKLCRAVACPRRVDDTALFCNVHLAQLTPRLLSPIRDNREAANQLDTARVRIVAEATNDAVTFIAKKEGRLQDLTRARRAQSFTPGQGGAGGSGGGGTPGGTGRPDLEAY